MSTESNLTQRPFSLRQPGYKPTFAARKTTLALGVSAIMMSPAVLAETEFDDEDIVEMDTLRIEDRTVDTNPYAEPGAPYKAKVSGDPRHVKPLAETPQTINVLTGTQIEESGRTDLKEILQAQPGVTIGTGENGNAFGDRYDIFAGLDDVATLRRLADDMQATVQRELRPNGGSSMHDRLVRIEASMEDYRKQADEDRKLAAADRSRIWDALLALARGSALDG